MASAMRGVTSTFRLTLALGGAATVGVLLLLLIIYSLTERELNIAIVVEVVCVPKSW